MQIVPTTLVRISRYYMLAAAGYLLLTILIGLLRVTSGIPDVRVHWIPAVLGWVSFPIMGAYYQFFPTLQGGDLRHERLAVPQFLLVNVGVLSMLAAAWLGSDVAFSVALVVYAAGAYLFVAVMLGNVQPNKLNLTLRFYLASLGYFSITVSLMLWRHFAQDQQWISQGLLLHLFAFGWAIVAIMGAEYSMVPMLQLKELRHPRLANLQFYLVNAGTIALAVGIASGQAPVIAAAGTLATLAIVLFAFNIWASLRFGPSRLKKLDLSVRFFVTGIAYLIATALIGTYVGATGSYALLPIHLHLGLIGAVSNTIVGAAYHIVPFVVWWEVYAPRLGSEPVPLLKELFDERAAMRQYYGLNAGLALMVAGFALDINVMVALGGALLALVASDYVNQMLRVVRHRRLLKAGQGTPLKRVS